MFFIRVDKFSIWSLQIFNIHHLKFDYTILHIVLSSQFCILIQILSNMVGRGHEERIRNQVDTALFYLKILSLVFSYSTDKYNMNNKLFVFKIFIKSHKCINSMQWIQVCWTMNPALQNFKLESKKGTIKLVLYPGTSPNNT